MLNRWICIVLMAALLGLFSSAPVTAEEKSTVEEILDILKNRGVINQDEHDQLLERAKAEEAEERPPNAFRVYWKDGIRMDSNDKRFKLKLGGRIMTDFANINADDDTENFLGGDETGTGVEFRRARIYFQGTIYDRLEFKSQFDFAGGDADFKDMYVGLKDIPYVGHIRVGHMKEPFSLEELTSSKYITFMERGLPNAFAPGRNTGITFFNNPLEERLGWSLGFYREADDFGDGFDDDTEYNLTARLRGLPWYADEGRRLVHVGFSYSHKFRDEGDPTTLRFRARPEAHLSEFRYVDTGDFLSDGADLLNPELAVVYGPFSIQGEYMYAMTDSAPFDDPEFWGFYVFGSYFITGENRAYRMSSGSFGRVKPKHNFLEDGGLGAWEIAFRYSYLDLTDNRLGEVDGEGGNLGDFTAGINWYLNPNLRVMLNYVFADLDDVGDTHIVQSRFQIDF
jgi:phosphate-selective porin OprO/OprP